MKIRYAAALLMLFTTPAFCNSKADNGVPIECTLTGSGDSGFDIAGDNAARPGQMLATCCFERLKY